MNFYRRFLLLVAVSMASLGAFAQGGNPDVTRPIVARVVAGDSPLTQSMHSDFWREINKGPPMEPEQLRASMTGALSLNLQYQRAVWESARESLRSKRVLRTPALEKIEAAYISQVSALVPTTDATKRRDAVQEVERAFGFMKDDAARLLKAAASESAFIPRGGQPTLIDDASVTATLKNLAAIQSRLNRLFDPVWRQG